MNMNYAILGPGKALSDNLKQKAKNIISETVTNVYFYDEWRLRNKKRNYSIWNENGKFSGFAIIEKPKGTRGIIQINLIGAVKGRGIGSQLLKQILVNAYDKKLGRGIRRVNLNSVTNAIPFYKKFGFKEKGTKNNNHYYMSLALPRPKPIRSDSLSIR